jgi:hypothetical protein
VSALRSLIDLPSLQVEEKRNLAPSAMQHKYLFFWRNGTLESESLCPLKKRITDVIESAHVLQSSDFPCAVRSNKNRGETNVVVAD